MDTNNVWLPLEANPDVLNKYSKELGLDLDKFEFVDVWGLDDELLAMIPQPVYALLFLFPITEESEKQRDDILDQTFPKDLIFIEQTIANACGTIGLLHALFNNIDNLHVQENAKLNNLYNLVKDKNPHQIAKILEKDSNLAQTHDKISHEGQTEAPSRDEDVDLHFVCFISSGGSLYELDGRKQSPINHGPASDLLFDGAKAIKAIMEKNPQLIQFNLMALCRK